MQGASQPNDDGSVPRDQHRERVVWARTQALAALLLFVVFWTMAAWYYRQTAQETSRQIPTDLVVELNQATLAELNLLPGVGEKLASDILKYRDEIGGFQSIDELMNIRGIKEGRLSSLKKHIRVRNKRPATAP